MNSIKGYGCLFYQPLAVLCNFKNESDYQSYSNTSTINYINMYQSTNDLALVLTIDFQSATFMETLNVEIILKRDYMVH